MTSATWAERSPTPSDAGDLLEVEGLYVTFTTPEGVVRAVNGLDLTVAEGEMLAILGESGSGKSVTMQALLGLVPSPPGTVTSRRLRFGDQELSEATPRAFRRVRAREIGMVFQDAPSSLDPGRTVGSQIAEVLRVHEGLGRREARLRAVELMDRVRIPSSAKRAKDYPHQFSGGMCQRIMIAIAIALQPRLLIADEPTTALDVTVQAQIMDLVQELRKDLGMAVVLITHDVDLAAENADRVLVMYAGSVMESGPMAEIHGRPMNPYTRGLLASVPSAPSTDGRMRPIPGSPPVLSKLPDGCTFAPRCEYVEDRCWEVHPALEPIGPARSSACHVITGDSDV